MPIRLVPVAVAVPDLGAAAVVDAGHRGARGRPVLFLHPADPVGAIVELEEV